MERINLFEFFTHFQHKLDLKISYKNNPYENKTKNSKKKNKNFKLLTPNTQKYNKKIVSSLGIVYINS